MEHQIIIQAISKRRFVIIEVAYNVYESPAGLERSIQVPSSLLTSRILLYSSLSAYPCLVAPDQ